MIETGDYSDDSSPKAEVILFTLLLFITVSLYAWSSTILKKPFELSFVVSLLVPCAYYYWMYSNNVHRSLRKEALRRKVAFALVAYGFAYFLLTYFINILAASVALWLVQFIVPVMILRISQTPPSTVGFEWGKVFHRFSDVIIVCALLTPFLFFGVRDSEAIRQMAKTWSFYLFLPLSALYMLVIVAFWEEFFFVASFSVASRLGFENWQFPFS